MLKEYIWRGTTWQFEEGEEPDGAVPVQAKKPAPKAKARTAANKSRRAATKEA